MGCSCISASGTRSLSLVVVEVPCPVGFWAICLIDSMLLIDIQTTVSAMAKYISRYILLIEEKKQIQIFVCMFSFFLTISVCLER